MQCCKGKHPFNHDRKLACVIAVKKMRNTGGIMLYRKVSYRTISSKLAMSFLRNFRVFEFVIAWLLNGRMRKLNTQPFFNDFIHVKQLRNGQHLDGHRYSFDFCFSLRKLQNLPISRFCSSKSCKLRIDYKICSSIVQLPSYHKGTSTFSAVAV